MNEMQRKVFDTVMLKIADAKQQAGTAAKMITNDPELQINATRNPFVAGRLYQSAMTSGKTLDATRAMVLAEYFSVLENLGVEQLRLALMSAIDGAALPDGRKIAFNYPTDGSLKFTMHASDDNESTLSPAIATIDVGDEKNLQLVQAVLILSATLINNEHFLMSVINLFNASSR